MAGQQGVISEIISEQALSDIERVPSALQEVTKAFKDSESVILQYAKTAREAANALLSVNSMGQLVEATKTATEAQNALTGKYNEMQKLRERIIYLESEEAKQMAELREQVKQLNQANKESSDTYKRNAEAKAAAAAETKRLADEDRELNRLIKEEERSKVADQRKKEALAAKEKTAADREYVKTYEQLLRQREIDEKNAADLNNAYLQLSKRYNEAALAAKNLQLSETATVEEQKEAIRVANELGNKLKALDASVGQHGRNVGNYKDGYSGLNLSIQQILREAPSAAVSLNTFFLAISNNLPMLFDEIQKVNEGMVALKATAAASNVELQKQTAIQQAAGVAASDAEESLANQVESVISSIGASNEQALAIREKVAAQVAEIRTTGTATAETVANTQAELTNAGATAEQVAAIEVQITATATATRAAAAQTAALQRQAVATAEANAAAKASPTLLSQVGRSLFSINTLLTLGVLALTLYGGKIIEAFGGASEEAKKAEEANKKYKDSLKEIEVESRATAATEAARLQISAKIAADQKATMSERLNAIAEIKKANPEYFAGLENEAFLYGKVANAVRGVTEAILAKASSQASLKQFSLVSDSLEKLRVEYEDTQKKIDDVKLDKVTQNLVTYDRLSKDASLSEAQRAEAARKASVIRNYADGAALAKIQEYRQEQEKLAKQIKEKEEEQSKYLERSQKAQEKYSQLNDKLLGPGRTPARIKKELDEVNKQLEYTNINTERSAELIRKRDALDKELESARGKTKTVKVKDNTKEEIKLQQDLTKETADEQAKRRLLDAQAQELILQDESLSFKDRLAAIQAFYQAKKDAADISNKGEIDAVQKSLDKIKELEAKRNGGGKLTNEQQNLIETKVLLEQRLTNLQLDGDQKRLQNSIEYGKAVSDATKKYGSEEVNYVTDNLERLTIYRAEQYKKDLDSLTDYRRKGEITEKEFNARKKALAAKLEREMLDDQIAYVEESIKLLKLEGVANETQINGLVRKLDELKTARSKVQGEVLNDDIGTLLISKKDFTNLEHYSEAFISTFQGISDVLDKISQKRIAQIQSEIDAIDERTRRELDALDRTSLTNDQKQRKAAEINARAENQKVVLAEKQKQREISDAKRQKALTIAKITIETALAVVKALNSAPYPANIALAVAAGVVGAAQIAVAAATPIPSYAEGTEDHPGGEALIGDNKSGRELVIEPGKKPYVTKGPEIKYLPMHTQVFPEEKLMAASYAMLSQSLMVSLDKQKQDNTDITKRLDKLTDINKRQVEALYGLRPKPKHTSIFGSNNQNWINS